MGKIIDLAGQKFENLTVQNYLGKITSNHCVFWKCKCDCGKDFNATSYGLRKGYTRSCGCKYTQPESPAYIDITGQKFGYLTALTYTKGNFKGSLEIKGKWNCLCDCGNYYDVPPKNLRNGNTKSCGCKTGYLGSLRSRKNNIGEIRIWVWTSIIDQAKKRNIPVSIQKEDIWNQFLKQDRKCALTGVELKFSQWISNRKETTASLDRIDNTKGYSINNIQWIHKDINWMKGRFPQNKFIYLTNLVSNHSKNPHQSFRIGGGFDYSSYQIT